MARATLLRVLAVVFCKSKNGIECKNFAALLCLNVNILFVFMRRQERRSSSPYPPKSATACTSISHISIMLNKIF